MNRPFLLIVAAAGLLTALVCAGTLPRSTAGASPQAVTTQESATTKAAATTYKIDAVHSTAMFKVRHLGVSNFYGRFNELEGTFVFDPANPDNSRFEVTIAVNSVDTNNKGRDDHLKSPSFFNAKEFSTATFTSTKVESLGGNRYRVGGDLQLRGVSKTVSAELEWYGEKLTSPRFGPRAGCEAVFTFNRSEFGMDAYVKEGTLGDAVTITVSMEGIKQ